MATRYIYLSDDLNNKLKKEDNASGLIQALLIEHYQDERTEEQIIRDTHRQIDAKQLEREKDERIAAGVAKRTKEMKIQKAQMQALKNGNK